MDGWTEEEIVDWWRERSAIMEIDGGKSEQTAKLLAAREVKKKFGAVPDSIKEMVFG